MACTCRECLELAARGASAELMRCVAQDPISGVGSGNGDLPPLLNEISRQARISSDCEIRRLQIVPFGLDEQSSLELEDPDERAYIWELC